MSRVGRTPMYPQFFEKKYPNRRLFLVEGQRMYAEDWGVYPVNTFEEIVRVLFAKNGLAFVYTLEDPVHFPYLMQALHDKTAEIMCTQDGHPLAIRIERKSQARWIVPVSSWDKRFDEDFLPNMRAMYDYFRMVKPTPGSLGQALIRRQFFVECLAQQTACNAIASNFLRLHGVGGRCDVYHVGETFETLLELDASSAYLAHAQWEPGGTPHLFHNGHSSTYATYFAECEVTIHETLPLGPFPVRVSTGRAGYRIVYPILPGRYRAFLWKEQVQASRDAGCTVIVKEGVGWDYLTNCLQSWCRYMYHSRIDLAGTPLEQDTKKIAVSALGHFGMNNTFHRLTQKDVPGMPNSLNVRGEPMSTYIETYEDYSSASMLHWFNYTIAMNALTLYRLALPFALDDRLIMTNYDALLIVEKDERSKYARKHSIEALMCEMGDLRWQELTHVTILGERSLKCDQKIITPGIEKVEVEL